MTAGRLEGPPAPTTTTARRPYRHRALAELDRLIAQAEEARTRRLAGAVAEAAAAPVVAGKTEAGRAETVLGLVDERLAALRRSRAALLADEAR